MRAFGRALELRDIGALARLLTADVTVVIDGGGTGSPTGGPVCGIGDGIALLLRMAAAQPECVIAEHPVNGHPGLAVRDEAAVVVAVISVEVRRGRVCGIWVVTNPGKLAHWNR